MRTLLLKFFPYSTINQNKNLTERATRMKVTYIYHSSFLVETGTCYYLFDYFKGNHLILINKSSTPRDGQADLIINDSIGEVFGQL